MISTTLPYTLTTPVSSVFNSINWSGQTVLVDPQQAAAYPYGIPTMLMDWTVDQFFNSIQWSGIRSQEAIPLPASLQIDSIAVEEPFTLSDLSSCF